MYSLLHICISIFVQFTKHKGLFKKIVNSFIKNQSRNDDLCTNYYISSSSDNLVVRENKDFCKKHYCNETYPLCVKDDCQERHFFKQDLTIDVNYGLKSDIKFFIEKNV